MEPESEDEEEHNEWEAQQKARWEQYQMVKQNENGRHRKNGEGALKILKTSMGTRNLKTLKFVGRRLVGRKNFICRSFVGSTRHVGLRRLVRWRRLLG